MDGMTSNFVKVLVFVGILVGIYIYCDHENIVICFGHNDTEWCILDNKKKDSQTNEN